MPVYCNSDLATYAREIILGVRGCGRCSRVKACLRSSCMDEVRNVVTIEYKCVLVSLWECRPMFAVVPWTRDNDL